LHLYRPAGLGRLIAGFEDLVAPDAVLAADGRFGIVLDSLTESFDMRSIYVYWFRLDGLRFRFLALLVGMIYSLLAGKAPQDCVDFAVSASCLKHTIVGDPNMVTVAEVEHLIKSGGSGRVQR
jgi:hypothetical protein